MARVEEHPGHRVPHQPVVAPRRVSAFSGPVAVDRQEALASLLSSTLGGDANACSALVMVVLLLIASEEPGLPPTPPICFLVVVTEQDEEIMFKAR